MTVVLRIAAALLVIPGCVVHAGRPGDGAPLPAAYDANGANGGVVAARRTSCFNAGGVLDLALGNDDAASVVLQPKRSLAFAAVARSGCTRRTPCTSGAQAAASR